MCTQAAAESYTKMRYIKDKEIVLQWRFRVNLSSPFVGFRPVNFVLSSFQFLQCSFCFVFLAISKHTFNILLSCRLKLNKYIRFWLMEWCWSKCFFRLFYFSLLFIFHSNDTRKGTEKPKSIKNRREVEEVKKKSEWVLLVLLLWFMLATYMFAFFLRVIFSPFFVCIKSKEMLNACSVQFIPNMYICSIASFMYYTLLAGSGSELSTNKQKTL